MRVFDFRVSLPDFRPQPRIIEQFGGNVPQRVPLDHDVTPDLFLDFLLHRFKELLQVRVVGQIERRPFLAQLRHGGGLATRHRRDAGFLPGFFLFFDQLDQVERIVKTDQASCKHIGCRPVLILE